MGFLRKAASMTDWSLSSWLTSPFGMFPVAYVTYFGLGSVNVFPYRGEVSWRTVGYAALGLMFYLLGVLSVQRVFNPRAVRVPTDSTRDLPVHLLAATGFGLLCGGVAAMATIFSFGGLPLFAGEARLQASARTMSLAYLAVLATCVIGMAALHQHAGRVGWVVVAVVTPALLLLGFRTLPLAIVSTLVVSAILVGRLRITWRVAAGGLLAGIGLAWLAVFRFGAGPRAYFEMLHVQGMPAWFAPLAPLWITLREGVGVLNTLTELVPRSRGFEHGELFASSFLSVLPGKQESARGIVGDLVGARPGITITPSILGQPYVDFGVLGIAFELMFLGMALTLLYLWASRARTWMPSLFYSFALSTALLAIHSGLLDPVIFASLALLGWYSWFSERETATRSSARLCRVGEISNRRSRE